MMSTDIFLETLIHFSTTWCCW